MQIAKISMLIILSLGITACASWREQAYTGQGEQVESIPELRMPQDVSNTQIREYYPIPDVVHERQNNTISITLPSPKYWP
jgi:uncharacterized lipoprotein